MRSGRTPTTSRQIASASSSEVWQVTQRTSGSSPNSSVTSSQAMGIASALK